MLLGGLLGFAAPASAHPLSTTAVLLDIGVVDVTGKIELPLDELSIARGERLTPDNVMSPSTLSSTRSYVRQHLLVSDAAGRTWAVRVAGGTVRRVDGRDNLILTAALAPASGPVGDFVLHYDAIMDTVLAHRVFVSARYGTSGSYTTVAMLSWQRQSVLIAAVVGPAASAAAPAPAAQGFLSAVGLGIEHIRTGSDHLLFLIMLLLPAPLWAVGRGHGQRWAGRPATRGVGWRVTHVVSAFAVGHSVTLGLGTLGWIDLPARLVESGIALSVLVSAAHAIRPVIRRGEVLIAGGFGLLHGLAFATLLSEFSLSWRSLVTTLLGFNVGIELAQLLVVAMIVPSLVILSRTDVYPVLRLALAGIGALLAAGWLAQRSTLITRNPLEPVGEQLVMHPIALATTLAVLAGLSWIGSRWVDRNAPDEAPPPTTSVPVYSGPVANSGSAGPTLSVEENR